MDSATPWVSVSDPESRVLAAFRARYAELRADLAAFDHDFRATDFDGCKPDQIREWCAAWWEARLGGRILTIGERQIRGTQGRN